MSESLKNIFLMVLSFILALTIMEVALRVTGYQGDHERAFLKADPRLGILANESWIDDLPRSQDQIRVGETIFKMAKEPEVYRVLFLGDSGTAGAGVKREENFPSRFETRFKKDYPGRKIQVINAAVAGMSPINEVFLYKKYLYRLQPDLVVVGLFLANDINFNLPYEPLLFDDNWFNSPGKRAWRWFESRSALTHFLVLHFKALNEKYKFSVWQNPNTLLADGNISMIDEDHFELLSYVSGEVSLYRKHPSVLMKQAEDLLEKTFGILKKEVEGHGSRLQIIFLPSPATVKGDLFIPRSMAPEELLKKSGLKKADLDFEKPLVVANGICQNLKLVCQNPLSKLRAHGEQDIFLPHDNHFSPFGHKIIGDYLYETTRNL
jgi:hypothetical protein